LKRAEKDSDVLLRSRLPEQSSQISNEIGKLAAANHVKLEQATYEAKETELPGVERLLVKASLSADYLNLVKFINALEREKMLMVIDSLKLNEQQGGSVKVDLMLEAFRRVGVNQADASRSGKSDQAGCHDRAGCGGRVPAGPRLYGFRQCDRSAVDSQAGPCRQRSFRGTVKTAITGSSGSVLGSQASDWISSKPAKASSTRALDATSSRPSLMRRRPCRW